MNVSETKSGTTSTREQLVEDLQQHQFELQQQNTELRRAHEELHRATERFHELWNDAPVGYLSLDRSGVITVANRRARTLLGHIAPVQEGVSLQRFLTRESNLTFRQHMWSVASSDVPVVAELQLKTPDDVAEVWIRVESTATSEGEYRFAVIDISRQKAAEANQRALASQLRQSQKMEVLNEMSAGIAHDFNNILQVIVGCAELSKTDLAARGESTMLIDKLLEGAQRGVDLTGRLLAFSRRSSLTAKTVDLRELVENTVDMAARTVPEGISIESHVPRTSLPISADGNLIEQAMLNLCVNARDAMPQGGCMQVRADHCKIADLLLDDGTRLPPGSYAMITVCDDGEGMNDDTRRKLFEPFYTTKETKSGTGLGLSIVYGIVRQHGGGITVDSRLGHGAIFTIYLPLSTDSPSDEEVESPESHNAYAHGSGTILVAEDEAAIREVLSCTLLNAGYNVITANDGLHAVELIKSFDGRIDLLLTDAIMPRKSGKDVCSQFHVRFAGAPVVFLTGHGDSVVDRQFLDEHQAQILSKPIRFNALLEMIGSSLECGDS